MTLDQFLSSHLVRNSYVKHPDFREMYVRKGNLIFFLDRFRDSAVRLENSLTLARVFARRPGQGAFTRLVDHLIRTYDIPLHVECVLEPRFAAHLLKAGWIQTEGDRQTPSFVFHWEGKPVEEFLHPLACPRIVPVVTSAGGSGRRMSARGR